MELSDTITKGEVKVGYKKTEVGVLPEEWEVIELGRIGTFAKGKGIRKDQVLDHGIPCVRYGELYTTHHDYIKFFKSYISRDVANQSQKLKYGDLLFAGSGETAEEIGKCVAFLVAEEAYAGGDIVILSPKGVDSLFLGYLLNSPSVIIQKISKGQGDAVVHISAKNLSDIIIPLPPTLAEQRAIATALSDVDQLIAALGRLIAKKKAIKLGAMQELLTGRRRLEGFSGEWVEKTLGELGEFKNGINKRKSEFGFGSPFVNLMDVFGIPEVGVNANFGLVNSNSAEQAIYNLLEGDVLFVRSSVKPSGVGLTTLVAQNLKDTVYSGFLIRFRDQGELDILFKKYCFHTKQFRGHLIANSTVSANTNINQVALKGLLLRYPKGIKEQRAIAQILSDLDAEIAALEQKRDKYQAIKQGMMQELLTGKTRLV